MTNIMDARSCVFLFVCICLLVDYSMAGECCNAYYDLTLDYHKQQWCDDYCCGSSFLGLLYCCSNILLVAPSGDRTGFCLDYFAKNIWAPIVIGLGGLGMCICCIVCCMACCGGNKNRGTVVGQAPQQPATNVIMMTPGGQYQQPPAHQGYGMHPGPAYPPQYQAVQPSGPGMPASTTQSMPDTNQGFSHPNEPFTETKHPYGSNEQPT